MGRINADDVAFSKAFGCSASNVQGIRVSDPLLLDAVRNLGPTRIYWNAKYFEFRLREHDVGDANAIKSAWRDLKTARKLSEQQRSDAPCPTEPPANASA